MEARSLKFVAEACGGELRRGAPDRMVTRVCTDSRQAAPGDLFVALAGERHDAHDHLPEVARRGAMAVLAERAKLRNELPSCAVIAVESTRAALGRLAARYRAEFSPAMCAVGGSNGKTSTKELIASVLRQKLPTVWNEASFNNDIGVPLTLLKLDRSHRAAVVEAGTNHPGELAPLLRMISPRFGVVTNIGREHLEFFGDLAGVAREEGALAEALPADGVLIVNGDDEWADALARRSPARVVRVGLGERNDFRAAKIRVDQDGTVFEVRSPQARLDGECRIRLLGRAQSVNALFAVALAAELGLGREEIGRGLA